VVLPSNLQNLPKPVTEKIKSGPNKGQFRVVAPGLRDCYKSHVKGGWIVCADYDQLELRIIALLAGDKPLIDLFNAGKDPHAANAADLFGVPVEEVIKQQRQMAKVAVYQVCYGGTPEELWKAIIVEFPKFDLGSAFRMHKMWFKKHPAISAWHERQLKSARDNQYIEAPLSGHRLPFYSRVKSTEVYNYPVQHTAADIINPTIVPLSNALDWRTEALVAQVHDELVTSGKNPILLAQKMKEHMTRQITLNGHTLTFTVGIKFGPNWGDVVEVSQKNGLEKGMREVMRMFREKDGKRK
jgi:DNA polymerase-1